MARFKYTPKTLWLIHRMRGDGIPYNIIHEALKFPKSVTVKQILENYLKHRRKGYFDGDEGNPLEAMAEVGNRGGIKPPKRSKRTPSGA